MSCTCSDQWKACNWTAQGPTPHETACPDGPGPFPKWCEWNPHYENIIDGLHARFTRGIKVARLVLNFKVWDSYVRWLMGQRHIAKIEYGVATLLTAAGEITVVAGDVPETEPRYEP